MPGTVQELASMFLDAIDSQGNVVNMGAVKEVVTALERCPVSAGDLKDLKSTRLGKYINQVRRTISDKSLAKRMKRLVIQWRSLAQQSPSTPNGVPAQITPPPRTSAPPSPSSPHTSTTLTRAPQTQISPPSHTPTQSTAVQQTSSLTPSSRPPPSTNPDINRKRALQRLSTIKFPQSQPQKPSSTQLPVPPRSTQHTLSPSPPIPSHPPVTPTQPPPVNPTPAGDPIAECSDEAVISSLQVRLPLPAVVKNLIVKVPLVRVNVSGVASNAKPPRQLTPVGNSISGAEVKLQAADPCRAKVINMKHSRDPHLSSHSLSATSDDITQTPPLTFEESRKERTSDPLTLIVSIDRDSLNQLHRHTAHSQPDVSTGTTASACEATQSLVTTAEEYSHPPLDCDKQPIPYSKESTPPSPHDMANVEYCGDRGYVDSGGVWRKWTDPIIHTDSFAVNVLPYVYVDGMDDDTGET